MPTAAPPQLTSRNPCDVMIHLVDCGSWIAAANFTFYLVDCGSCIGAAAIHDLTMDCGCHSLLGWVDFSLPQRCNISPFIPSPASWAPSLHDIMSQSELTTKH